MSYGNISQSKALGGIGSILVLLSPVPYAGPFLAVAGFVMVLIAVNQISNLVKDREIFNNMMISVVLSIAGVVAGALLVIGSVLRFIGLGSFAGPEWIPPPTISSGDIFGLVISILAGLALVWVFYIVSAVFLKRSYDSVATKLDVGMFRTAGTLYLIGAVLTILLVGFLLVFVAEILFAVAFFSIQEKAPATYVAAQPPKPT